MHVATLSISRNIAVTKFTRIILLYTLAELQVQRLSVHTPDPRTEHSSVSLVWAMDDKATRHIGGTNFTRFPNFEKKSVYCFCSFILKG